MAYSRVLPYLHFWTHTPLSLTFTNAKLSPNSPLDILLENPVQGILCVPGADHGHLWGIVGSSSMSL